MFIKSVAAMLLSLMIISALVGSGVAPSAYNLVENGGTPVTRRSTLNFVNGGCVDNSGAARTDCTFSGGSAFYQTIQVAGVNQPQEPALNFAANVTCTDSSGVSTNCTPSGGGGSVPLTGWTIQNNVSPTPTFNNFTASSVAFTQLTTSGVEWQIVTQAIPGATYTVTTTVDCMVPNVFINSAVCGLFLFDGTKAEDLELLLDGTTGIQLELRTLPTLTSGGSIVSGPTIGNTSIQATLRVHDDGTTRTWSYYNNGAFTTFLSEATGTFLTPTAVGVGGLCNNGTNATCTARILTWTATTP